MWLYDPGTIRSQRDRLFRVSRPPHDIVYFPPDDTFYVFSPDGRVWRLTLGRAEPHAVTVTRWM